VATNGAGFPTVFDMRARELKVSIAVHRMPRPLPVGAFALADHGIITIIIIIFLVLFMHISGHARCGKLSAGNGIDYRRYRIRLLAVPLPQNSFFLDPFYRVFICLRAMLSFILVLSKFGGI